MAAVAQKATNICLKGKTAIITGASSGIGEGIAIKFAQLGCQLVLAGRNTTHLRAVQKQCLEAGKAQYEAQGYPKSVVISAGELTQPIVRQKLVEDAIQNFGKLDILVNNAGIAKVSSFLEGTTTLQNFDEVFDINVKAVINLVLKAIPHLLKTKGNIVNMSSVIAHKPALPNYTFYTMSKAVLEILTRNMAQEFGPKGVRVNAISPAIVRSKLHERGGFIPTGMEESEYYSFARLLHPLARVGEPSDIADAVAFLASDRASFITGQTLLVDGGVNVHSFTTAVFGAISAALKANHVI